MNWLSYSKNLKRLWVHLLSEFPQCIRSGFCCQKAPCGFGEVTSPTNSACKFLGGDKAGEYFCMKYEEIKKHKGWEISPAFGMGCGSTLNPVRIKMLFG